MDTGVFKYLALKSALNGNSTTQPDSRSYLTPGDFEAAGSSNETRRAGTGDRRRKLGISENDQMTEKNNRS